MKIIFRKKNEVCKYTSPHLTFITIYSIPSRFTFKTRSIFYVTSVVFTVCGTWRVAVDAIHTGIFTPCMKSRYVTED